MDNTETKTLKLKHQTTKGTQTGMSNLYHFQEINQTCKMEGLTLPGASQHDMCSLNCIIYSLVENRIIEGYFKQRFNVDDNKATFTDRCKSTAALSYCSTAPNKTDDEKEGSYCNYDHSRDKGVYILKEVVIIIICDENIGSNIAQNPSCCL